MYNVFKPLLIMAVASFMSLDGFGLLDEDLRRSMESEKINVQLSNIL